MGCAYSVPTLAEGEGTESSGGEGSSGGRARADSLLPDIPLRREQIKASVQSFLAAERARPRVAIGPFRDIQKRRTLHEVIHAFANPTGQPFVLILDGLGAAVLSNQLTMSEIMFPEGPVALLENLAKKRQPCPTMEAVYFIAPTKQSLTMLLADFSEEGTSRQAMYKGAHLVFTSSLPPAGISLIRETPRLLRHMISFREVQADIFPLESHVVNFGLVGSLCRLFGHGHMNPLNADSKVSPWALLLLLLLLWLLLSFVIVVCRCCCCLLLL